MTTTVCIDGFNLALSRGSGIATYGRRLASSVKAMGLGTQVLYGPVGPVGKSALLDEVALVDGEKNGPRPGRTERYLATFTARWGKHAISVPRGTRVIWPEDGAARTDADAYWVSRDLFRTAHRAFQRYGTLTPVSFDETTETQRPTVMHWTAPLPLLARDAINLHTIHDLIPLRMPFSTKENKAHFLDVCRRLVERSDHIVVVSETTRRDVIELLGVPEDRITNTYQAASLPPEHLDRSDEEVAQSLEAAFNLGWKSYFLHYGAIEPKKNLGRVVEAYLASGISTPLVLVGSKGWLDQPETALLEAVRSSGGGADGRILQFEYLPAGTLANLIRGAKATVFPSLYEGFGLPVLESMLSRTAVLTANAGSLPEIAGDAALLVEPTDIDSIAAGLRALDADESLRAELVERGHHRAEFFSTEAYQRRLLALYHRIGAF